MGKGSIVVILVGAPGSGKSTFCDDVTRANASSSSSQLPWVRICQDSIANGKAGTKLQCLKSAADALKDGKSVFIDRCNLDQEQRADFMKLGGSGVDIHAVVLDLPARLCISRSVKRSAHEGNLQGGKAAAVVNRMLQNKELPKLSEGFYRITFCQNEGDVQDAVNMYSNLGPSDSLPSGCFGQKSADSKVQLGIMKFMKKVEPPKNVSSDGNCSKGAAAEEKSMEKDLSAVELENVKVDKESRGGDISESKGSYPVDASWNGVNTLAFPSISTSDFQFDHDKASDIIVERVGHFLNKVGDARLVLVDLRQSNILSLVRSKAAKQNIDPKKFFTMVGDITRLFTEGNLLCNVIANATNWRLKPGGGGVNAAIFNAAGEALEMATRECAGALSPGNSVVVPLPPSSPLYEKEGVTHVIHVLGPNMNPQRPNCLKNDYDKGCMVLCDAYSSLFENFASIIRGQSSAPPEPRCTDASKNLLKGNLGQLSTGDPMTKQGASHEPEKNKKSQGDDHSLQNSSKLGSTDIINNLADFTDMPDRKMQKIDVKERKSWPQWAQDLHRMAIHPEQHKAYLLEISDDYVVLNDLYPKAKRHILVLSRLDGLDSLSDVRREHLPLLKKMHSVGLKWAEKFINEDPTLIFRIGYHSVPSMRQLHLHVISQDFDSQHLKNKKHWNSFNTAFFRDSADAMKEIDKCGLVATVNDEKLLSMELRCYRCRSAHPSLPRLKSHISKCNVPLASGHLIVAPPTASSDK